VFWQAAIAPSNTVGAGTTQEVGELGHPILYAVDRYKMDTDHLCFVEFAIYVRKRSLRTPFRGDRITTSLPQSPAMRQETAQPQRGKTG
jgi:hypothetical protein